MRLQGIEPWSRPWQGRILPLNHNRLRCAIARRERRRDGPASARQRPLAKEIIPCFTMFATRFLRIYP